MKKNAANQKSARQSKVALPRELQGRTIHPALHMEESFVSVGILDQQGTWRIVTGSRQIYEAGAIKDALRPDPMDYPDLAWRWCEEDIQAFLKTGNCPGFGEILAAIIGRARAVLELPRTEHYTLLAVWIVATYFHPLFLAFPLLPFMGERESGKSKTLALISLLSFNGLLRVAPTPAVLFRLIEALRPTLCLDEMEGLDSEDRHVLLGIINAGYKSGGKVDRVEGEKVRRVVPYNVYAPKAFASIRGLTATTEDRAIPLVLQRGTRPDLLNAEVNPEDSLLAHVRAGLYRLLLTKNKEVQEAYDNLFLPEWLTGRVRELWKPLLAIATLADNEEPLGLFEDLLALARAHLESRDSISDDGAVLLDILEDMLQHQNEGEIEITPGELCSEIQQRLNVKDFSAQRVGGILRRLGFAKSGRRGGLSRYVIMEKKVREIRDRHSPPRLA